MEPTLRSVRLGGLLVLCMTWALPAAAQPVRDHLECYKVKDPQPKARYTADVAGLTAEPGCTIKVPATMVCVPASKTSVQPAPPGGGATGTPNAFGCYKVKCPAASLPAFRLNDQFGSRSVTPIASRLLCAPSAPLCTGAVDCPIGTACNTTTGQCDPACGDASHSVCHGGCCGGGTCQPGTVATACGNGGDCALCDASNQSGSACVAGHCGCTSPADCPAASGESAGRACLLAGVFVCVSQCNAPNVGSCNGGCCSAALDGTCQSGTADTACGNGGGTCVDCTSSLATCTSGSCM